MRKLSSKSYPISGWIAYWTGKIVLKLLGWTTSGSLPDVPKCVIIAAPHTSNWDFIIMLSIAAVFHLKMYWMGKSSLFKWPFRRIMLALGGIPIDRSSAHNMVDQAVEAFGRHERLALAIPPEGTRKWAPAWKSGFYHIAVGAKVPILLAFADFKRKQGGFGPIIMPTGDANADLEKIREFYAPMEGKHPKYQGPVCFAPKKD